MKQEIQEELKQAMRERDEVKTGTLRMLLASMLVKEKEGTSGELTDEKIQDAVIGEVKKRREAIEAFEKGGRPEMAEREKKEMEILQKYLPEQLSSDDVRLLVAEAIKTTGATKAQDMGKVMATLMPKVKGKADGALVSAMVKELLTAQ